MLKEKHTYVKRKDINVKEVISLSALCFLTLVCLSQSFSILQTIKKGKQFDLFFYSKLNSQWGSLHRFLNVLTPEMNNSEFSFDSCVYFDHYELDRYCLKQGIKCTVTEKFVEEKDIENAIWSVLNNIIKNYNINRSSLIDTNMDVMLKISPLPINSKNILSLDTLKKIPYHIRYGCPNVPSVSRCFDSILFILFLYTLVGCFVVFTFNNILSL